MRVVPKAAVLASGACAARIIGNRWCCWLEYFEVEPAVDIDFDAESGPLAWTYSVYNNLEVIGAGMAEICSELTCHAERRANWLAAWWWASALWRHWELQVECLLIVEYDLIPYPFYFYGLSSNFQTNQDSLALIFFVVLRMSHQFFRFLWFWKTLMVWPRILFSYIFGFYASFLCHFQYFGPPVDLLLASPLPNWTSRTYLCRLWARRSQGQCSFWARQWCSDGGLSYPLAAQTSLSCRSGSCRFSKHPPLQLRFHGYSPSSSPECTYIRQGSCPQDNIFSYKSRYLSNWTFEWLS